jgi:hypothetical protein
MSADVSEEAVGPRDALRTAAINVVRAAFWLLDGTEDDGLDEMRIDRSYWIDLSNAMDALEALDPVGDYNCIGAIEAAVAIPVLKDGVP